MPSKKNVLSSHFEHLTSGTRESCANEFTFVGEICIAWCTRKQFRAIYVIQKYASHFFSSFLSLVLLFFAAFDNEFISFFSLFIPLSFVNLRLLKWFHFEYNNFFDTIFPKTIETISTLFWIFTYIRSKCSLPTACITFTLFINIIVIFFSFFYCSLMVLCVRARLQYAYMCDWILPSFTYPMKIGLYQLFSQFDSTWSW